MPNVLHLRARAGSATFQWLSAPGVSALALLLLDGCDADAPARPTLVHIADEHGAPLDQAMACEHRGHLLLTCHGGTALRAAVQAALVAGGFTPGTLSFFGRNRFESETLGLLAAAQGSSAVTMTLEAARQEEAFRAAGEPDIERLLRASASCRFLYEPPRVQLWGPVNSGKSSLLNVLCDRELAAAGPEPGLTRDVIEGRLEHDGFVLRLFDAPGTWAGNSELDLKAQELALVWKAKADLVLELNAGTAKLDPAGWVIHSRADETHADAPAVSVGDSASLEWLKGRLVDHFFGPLRRLPPTERYLVHPGLREELTAGKLAEVRSRWLV